MGGRILRGLNSTTNSIPIFDAHFHIIDKHYPLIENNGYLPAEFSISDYQARMGMEVLCGGAVVSGSFQGFDQSYLVAALSKLPSTFVGVTQLQPTVSDTELLQLNEERIRAVRFNLRRGAVKQWDYLANMAARIYDLLGWHIELYVDCAEIDELIPLLQSLPKVSIDHLGLSKAGYKNLCKLVESGVKVKVTGFGRIDLDVKKALTELYSINPNALMFGTDLPSTRAARPYRDSDLKLVLETLDESAAKLVLAQNALVFYNVAQDDLLV